MERIDDKGHAGKGAMDAGMIARIDSILERVKDPESGLSVAQLGIVTKVRFSEGPGILYIFTDFGSHRPGCVTCAGIAMALSATIQKNMEGAFREEFPGLEIVFV